MKISLRHLIIIPSAILSLPSFGQNNHPVANPAPREHPEYRHPYEDLYPLDLLGLEDRWMPDKGLMLTPMRDSKRAGLPDFKSTDSTGREFYDTRRTLPYELDNSPCITFKLQKDFKVTDENADPATFRWTKDAGVSGVWNVDAAARFDLWIPGMYSPTGAEASLAFGYEIHRNESPASMVDLQSYHISIPFVDKVVFGRIPFLQTSDQVFQVDVSYNRDGVSGDSGFDIETDYRPTFKIPIGNYGLWLGARCSMEDGKTPLAPGVLPSGFYYLLEPKFGLSYGDRYTLGSPIVNLGDELVASYQLKAMLGKRLGKSEGAMAAEISYTLKGGNSLSGGESFLYHQARFQLKPGATSPVSFDVTYTKGADGFAQPDMDQLTVGFGVQF